MLMALDLTRRQAARVLEQALRSQTPFDFELPARPQLGVLRGSLVGRVEQSLVLRMHTPPARLDPRLLIGAYLDVRLLLLDDLYLFTTTVIDLPHRPAEGTEALVAEPEVIQLANRRRFERSEMQLAALARVWFDPQGAAHEGLLASVSANGLAVHLAGLAADDPALLGEPVRVQFELPGLGEHFELSAVICAKQVLRAEQQVQLGLEFAPPADAHEHEALRRLRAALACRIPNPPTLDEQP